MVFTALSSFNGVGINILHFAMSAFFIYYLFIYSFYLFYFIFCSFSSQGGIRLFNISSVKNNQFSMVKFYSELKKITLETL